jgi:hypothetical protein
MESGKPPTALEKLIRPSVFTFYFPFSLNIIVFELVAGVSVLLNKGPISFWETFLNQPISRRK